MYTNSSSITSGNGAAFSLFWIKDVFLKIAA